MKQVISLYTSYDIKFRGGMIMEDSEIIPRILANVYHIGLFPEQVFIKRGKRDYPKKG